ncbi:MAG: ABC transporter permease, partial [Acidobacteriia bacterium]|nr:ABC transporter permease [Terriglobia bacterium]
MKRIYAWLNALLHRRRMESEMDAELRFHLEACADDLTRSGIPRAEAERRARIEFGGLALAKEDCRRSLGLRLIDELRQDLRYAARSLRKTPGFTAAALASLALGIGANTVIFSFVAAVLLKAFPYREASALVDVSELDQNQMGRPLREILDLPAQSQTLAEIAVTPVFPASYNMTGPLLGNPERISAARVTANYFDLLGVSPALGNGFSAAQSGVLVSNRFWRTTLGANPAIAGKSVLLDGQEYRISGVLPPGDYDRTTLQLWIPIANTPKDLQKDDFYRTTARLKPGVTLAQANAGLARFKAKARTLRGALVRPETGKLLWLLAGAVGFVLVIACANLANLMLARAAARQREVAIRISTGAGRFRLVRQFLTESLVLSLAGGALGAALAALLLPAVYRIVPAYFLPLEAKPALDGRVLLFALAGALVTGLLFGAAPAWRFSAPSLSPYRRTHRLRDALLTAEAALAVVLAAGAGLMIHSFARLLAVDPGLRPERVVTWSVQFGKRPNEVSLIRAYQEEFLRRLRQVPAIESAAVSNAVPFSGGFTAVVEIAGAPTPKGDAMVWTVTPEYLATMGTRMLQGRWFTSADGPGAPPVAVVSRRFAQRYYGGARP